MRTVILTIVLLAANARAQLVIAHRGASGERPEHALAAYELAIDEGADYIEPDLVPTKDGLLVARHENALAVEGSPDDTTTDVATRPEFADRRTTKVIDGKTITGWFTEDFTLAELKQLRAVQRLGRIRSKDYDGRFEIATLQEIIDLVRRKGRDTGIYPELKHPAYFRAIGLPLEERLAAVLSANGYTRRDDRVFIQSFDPASLERMNTLTPLRLVLLIDRGGPPLTPEQLRRIAAFADGIGVQKDLIVPRDAQKRLLAPTHLIADAKAAGLFVHAWTFRAEAEYLPAGVDEAAEYARFFAAGVDGVFSDWPAHAIAARKRLTRSSPLHQ